MCHVSRVTCHVSRVMCHNFFSLFLLFFRTMWWSLSVEGLLSTGPTPSSYTAIQVSRKFGNFSINLKYGRRRISQLMRIVTQTKIYLLYLLIPWGGGVCTMQPSNVSIQQGKKMMGPLRCASREENDMPTSLCLEPLNVSIQQEKKMTGPIHCAWSLQMIMWSEGQWKGLKKRHGEGTW